MAFNRIALLTLLFIGLFSSACFSKKKPSPAVTANTGFAVVELFTSEGCSSCPAAEAVLSEVRDEYKQDVYVMEFHVDYWNNIGWKDVFSSSAYTARQQQYVQQFHLGSAYTPQAVVNGRNELVGSDRGKLHGFINSALQKKPANMLTLSAKQNGGKISVTYSAANANGQMINIALVQKDAETNVKRGENSGRKLKHINVVRAFTTSRTASTATINIDIPAGLSAADCTIIAYTQQEHSLEITGASQAQISKG